MISLHLALELRDAGVVWHPRTGDAFTILQPEMTGDVFTISDMMIEAHEFSTGTVLGFNGTTEWALDSVAQDDALWLPREDQLRELLGGTFVALQAHAPGGFVVVTRAPGEDDGRDGGAVAGEDPGRHGTARHHAGTAADAYAHAVLALVRLALDTAPA